MAQWHKLVAAGIASNTAFPPVAVAVTLGATVDALSFNIGITNKVPTGSFNATFSAQRISDDVWIPLQAYTFTSAGKAPAIFGTGQREALIVEIPPGVYDNLGISVVGTFHATPEIFLYEILARVS